MTRTFLATLVALHFLAAAFARPTAVGSAREAAVDDAAAQHVQAVQRGTATTTASRSSVVAIVGRGNQAKAAMRPGTVIITDPVQQQTGAREASRAREGASRIEPCSAVVAGGPACFTVRNPFPAEAGCGAHSTPIVSIAPAGERPSNLTVLDHTFNGTHTRLVVAIPDEGLSPGSSAVLRTTVNLACNQEEVSGARAPIFPFNTFLLGEFVGLADAIEALVQAIDDLRVTISGNNGADNFLDFDGELIQPLDFRNSPEDGVGTSRNETDERIEPDAEAEAPGPEPELIIWQAEDDTPSTTTWQAETPAPIDEQQEEPLFPLPMPMPMPIINCFNPPCDVPVPTLEVPTTLEELPMFVIANEVQENVINPAIGEFMPTIEPAVDPAPLPTPGSFLDMGLFMSIGG